MCIWLECRVHPSTAQSRRSHSCCVAACGVDAGSAAGLFMFAESPKQLAAISMHVGLMPCCRYTEFSGFHGILAAMLVAVKQIMPQQEVILGGAVRLSARVSRSRSTDACSHMAHAPRDSNSRYTCVVSMSAACP